MLNATQLRRVFRWMKASSLWSVVTGMTAFGFAVAIAMHAEMFVSHNLLGMAYTVGGVLAIFGSMQTVDGLIRFVHQERLAYHLKEANDDESV